MIEVAEEVEQALADGAPVVAMDSLLLSHGLPRPRNRLLTEQADAAVRDAGGVPAVIGLVDGRLRVGVGAEGLARLTQAGAGVRTLSWPDLPPALAAGGDGALTPGAAAMVARQVGLRVLATAGIVGAPVDDGGGAPDLEGLAASGLTVVSGGALPPADAAATLRRCSALGVSVVGVGVGRFPGCYRVPSEEPLDWVVAGPADVARVADARAALGNAGSAVLGLTGLPEPAAVPDRLHDRLVRAGRTAAQRSGVSGRELPAFLTGYLHAASQQRTLGAHTAVLSAVVSVAVGVAAALASEGQGVGASGDKNSSRLPKQSSA